MENKTLEHEINYSLIFCCTSAIINTILLFDRNEQTRVILGSTEPDVKAHILSIKSNQRGSEPFLNTLPFIASPAGVIVLKYIRYFALA